MRATYRQIDYWTRNCELGATPTPGSGHLRQWSPHELAKFDAIAEVAAWFRRAGSNPRGGGIGLELVKRFWNALDYAHTVTVQVGVLTLTATLPAGRDAAA